MLFTQSRFVVNTRSRAYFRGLPLEFVAGNFGPATAIWVTLMAHPGSDLKTISKETRIPIRDASDVISKLIKKGIVSEWFGVGRPKFDSFDWSMVDAEQFLVLP
jgi:hypothetical protein